MFARVMKEYGLDFDEVLALPLKRFWFLSNMVERLWAERDLRQVHLLASVGSADGFKAATDNLRKEIGTIYVWEEQFAELVINPETGLDVDYDRSALMAMKANIARS